MLHPFRRFIAPLTFGIPAFALVGACCEMTVTDMDARHAPNAFVKMAATDGCPARPEACGCPNNEPDQECPVVECASAATCNASRFCEYAATNTAQCKCFVGDVRDEDRCSYGALTCSIVEGIARWRCDGTTGPDCTGGSGDCGSNGQPRTCAPELFWIDEPACVPPKACQVGGTCGCPCTESTTRCVGAKVQVCSDCAWRIQEPVGAQVCVDGHYQCLLCQAGATECSPSGERVACAGCAWTPAPCRPDQSCAGGSCVDRCSGSQRWCARRGTCVPRCNACEALDPNSLTCRSYCGAGKECRGDACCYPCPPGSLVCPQPQCEGAPLIQDPC